MWAKLKSHCKIFLILKLKYVILSKPPNRIFKVIMEIIMISIQERFVVDERGQRLSVLLDIATYRRLLEELEELESLRAYDAAKASGDEAIPFEQAVAEIEQNRR